MKARSWAMVGVTLGICCVSVHARAVQSAELYSTAAYRYGKFEARLRFPAGDGIIGSFFLWKAGSELSGAYWNELDFEKIRADCALQINSIYGQPMAGHEALVPNPGNPCDGYHTYAFEWTPEAIAWLIDGSEVRRDTGAAARAFADNAAIGMQIHFNVWPGTPAFGGTFSPAALPAYQFVSWVQYSAYTPGGANGDFTLVFRESCDSVTHQGYALGNWVSPFQQSTHSPSNMVVTGGACVLALTADGATGFTGSVPPDSGDLPSLAGSAAGAGGSAGSAGAPTSSAGSGIPGTGADSGGCDLVRPRSGTRAPFALGMALVALALHRRKRLRHKAAPGAPADKLASSAW